MQFIDLHENVIATAVITAESGSPSPVYTYDYWTYAYYSDLGQIIAVVDANGVNTGSTAMPEFVTKYKYDYLGRMVEVNSFEEGISQYIYTSDRKT